MKKFNPYPWKPPGGRRRRRISPGMILAAIGLGIWVGGFVLCTIGWFIHK